MQTIGLLVEFKNGKVKEAVFGMVSTACGNDRQLIALVIDAPAAEARASLEAYGVGRIVDIRTGTAGWDPVVQAQALTAAIQAFDITDLIGLTSPTGRELLPRIAARLEAPLIMDCIAIDLEGRRVQTTQYSGKTIAAVALTGERFIYGLRANVVPPVKNPTRAEVVEFSFEPEPDAAYQVMETRSDGGSGPQLAESDVIFSGGRGMKNGENFKWLFDCARHIDAAVGASRVAVDNGWVPYAMQVGQTGVKVNPKVYLAFGISGSVQHYAGMKSAGTIIAVNSDENAAIMANCDYYATGDVFEILPELEKALAALHS
jgi:electron transfer flavoprotein alpha subunit